MHPLLNECNKKLKWNFIQKLYDASPHSLKDSNVNSKMKTLEEEGIGVRSLNRNTLGLKQCAGALGCELGKVTSGSIIHTNLYKSNNKLINVQLEHFWCTCKPQAYTDSQDSSQFGLGENHHLPTYSILCDYSWELHINIILSQHSQLPEILEIGTSGTLDIHNFFYKPSIEVRSQEKLWPHQEIFNDMWHTTCTHLFQGDSHL